MKIDFTGLNPSQKEAVETLAGPLLVLAGAGTGKTRVITYRIANLLMNWVAPENILALTFTNKSAREMRERIQNLVDKKRAKKIFLGTFHAFCIRILRYEVKNTSLHNGFTIADDVDQKSILKQAVGELGFAAEKVDINIYRSVISNAKNEVQFPKDYANLAHGFFEKQVAKIYSKYQEILQTQNMVDFDDILIFVVKLWETHPNILKKYQEIYKYLLVDEFQDTNQSQFRVIELLAGEKKNICVVGDDDQSIYGWRGAKVENILNFPQHFKGAKVVKLEQNYRSTNTILKAANSFIAGNAKRHDKVLWSKRGEGQKIKLHETSSDVNEPVFVANEIYRIMLSNSSLKYKDIAILYRSNHQSRLFEQQLRHDNIPYKLVGSKSFYDRREIRDAVAYVKLIANPRDDQSFLRIIGVPSRGLGLKAIGKLRDLQSKQNLPLCTLLEDDEFLSSVSGKGKSSAKEFSTHFNYWSKDFSEPGNLSLKIQNYFLDIGFLNGFQKMYKNSDEADIRRDNVLEFVNAIAQFETFSEEDKTLVDFLESFSLSDDNDKVDEDEENNNNSVTLLTVHASKGLEFPHIFIVGMEQNIFPHSRALEGRDIDEERRLFYVAITRAKDGLVISHSKTRFKFGKKEYQLRSDFLDELPEELLEEHTVGPAVEDDVVENAFSDFYDQFSIE